LLLFFLPINHIILKAPYHIARLIFSLINVPSARIEGPLSPSFWKINQLYQTIRR